MEKSMKKIILATLLMAFMPTVVHAQDVQEPPAPWDGSVSPFLNFDMNDHIMIYTPADLAALHALWDNYNDGDQGYKGYTILLMNDLDMNNINFNGHTIGWNDDNKFGGTFDGQGHIIRNLKIEGNNNNRGLFGKIDNGKVMNLKLVDVDIRAGDGDDCHIGAICGKMYNHSTISHCAVVGGSVRAYEKDNDEFGAICGYMTNNHNTIEYCYSNITVEADYQVGGLVGKIEQGDDNTSGIYHCYFSGKVIHYGKTYFASIAGERYSEKLQNNFYLYRDDNVRGTGWDGGSADPSGAEIAACTEEQMKQPFLFSIYNEKYTIENDQYIYTLGYPELKVFVRYNAGDSYYVMNVGHKGENTADSISGHVRVISNEQTPFTVALEKTIAVEANSDITINETLQPYFDNKKQLNIIALGANAFENLGVVNSVTIPATVDSVAIPQRHQVQNAFVLAEGSSSGAVKDGGLYSVSRKCFLTAPKNFETLTIHQEFADSIADYAFENMGNLKTLYINTFVEAGTLVDDKDNKAPTIDLKGDHIFDGCSPELDVYIKDGTTNQLIYGHQGPKGYGFTNAEGWNLFYSDYQDVENHMFSYFPINRTPGGMSTLILGYPVEMPEGVTAWWAQSIGDGKLKLKKIPSGIVPALTPVLLSYEGTGTLYLSRYEGSDPGSAIDYENNLFKGSVDPSGHKMTASEMMTNFLTLDRPVGDNSYDNLGFYAYHPKNNTLPPYVAWLAMSDIPSEGRIALSFDDNPTGIEEMQAAGFSSQDSEEWYDLSGRKLSGKPTVKGIYIVNGKKVFIP